MQIETFTTQSQRNLALVAGAGAEWPTVMGQIEGVPPIPSPFEQDAASAGAFVQANGRELQQKIYSFEPETLKALAKANERLAREGKPPVHLKKVTEEVEAITNDPSLSSKEKQKRIEEVRKRLGLSKGEMKNLVTGRLKRIYGEQLAKLREYRKQVVGALKQELAYAEKTYGKDSPQAAVLRQRIEGIEAALAPYEAKLGENHALYKSMYRSFWSRLGGFFKKIGGGIKSFLKSTAGGWIGKALGTLFPPLGRAIEIGKKVYTAAKGVWGLFKKF